VRSVAFFNNKDGVGKTTLLCNVAACIALFFKKKVCVVDADPQCNATHRFFDDNTIDSLYSDDTSFTVFKVLEPLSLGEGYNQALSV
jgi:cellulose biosynthesis protein BcsQ